MLTPGHIAASYLISKLPIRRNKKLKTSETLFIVFSGNSFDLDFLLPPLFGYPGGLHHNLRLIHPFSELYCFHCYILHSEKSFRQKHLFLLA